MKKNIVVFISLIALVVLSGCATWNGIKHDTSKAYDSTKEAIHEATD